MGMRLYAAHPHYRQHSQRVWDGLSAEARSAEGYALAMSYRDVLSAVRAGEPHVARLAHGAAQAYPGRPATARNPFCPGGINNGAVELFLTPNEYAADLWRAEYPDATVEVVGQLCPRPDRRPGRKPVVAISFHWANTTIPEARPALDHYRSVIPDVARHFDVILHGHPRGIGDIERIGRDEGIEVVRDFDEVCQRADVYACDNSSTIYEFAATDRPVVLLDAPWYDRSVHHGLRFWDAADVGPRVGHPSYLIGAIGQALEDHDPEARHRAVAKVFAYPDGVDRAISAIERWSQTGG